LAVELRRALSKEEDETTARGCVAAALEFHPGAGLLSVAQIYRLTRTCKSAVEMQVASV
jgi:hypothetical protein